MRRAHLVGQVGQEQHLAIGDRREPVPEPTLRELRGFGLHRFLGCLPVHAVRRVGHAEVEGAAGELVVGQGVGQLDVGGVLALGDHVGLADRIRLVVDLLAVQREPGFGVALRSRSSATESMPPVPAVGS